ncbi:MAG: hypothetical protein HY370_04745 [Proteobacteria bacterium]|nr:hypothetical protein [Pseudomonadota bacterium]
MSAAKTGTISVGPQKKAPKRRTLKEFLRKWRNAGIGVFFFLSFLVWFGMQPVKGTIHVGICRVFLELNLKYPPSFRFVQYDLFQSAHRIYYTFTGPFGETRSNLAECTFSQDSRTGYPVLEGVNINRQPVDRAQVDAFNRTIPLIMGFEIDRIVPRPYTGDLMDLKRD